MNKIKVFLGGTCADTNDYRESVTKALEASGYDYFNPIVDDWDKEAQKNEVAQKEVCDVHLYVITSAMMGTYSIAEVVESAITRSYDGQLTIFLRVREGFCDRQWRSLDAVASLVENYHATSITAKTADEAPDSIVSIIKEWLSGAHYWTDYKPEPTQYDEWLEI